MSDRAPPRVNVTFGASAAGSLTDALATLGRDEEVIWLDDDLSYGPINPGDARQRMQWMDDELGLPDEHGSEKRIDAFWTRVTSLHEELVVWMSRRYVTEYCGLLELLWRVNNAPVLLVDVGDLSNAFATLRDEKIVDHDLPRRATPVTDAERTRCHSEWHRLRQENAPLRVLTDAGVASTPLTYLDNILISLVPSSWVLCEQVMREAIFERAMEGPYRQCSADLVWFERLLRLMDGPDIEGRNEQAVWSMRDSWVRRRPTP